MAEPKKRGALVALLGFGGKASDKPEPEDGARYSKGTDPGYDAAAESLLQKLNVPEERRQAAKDALRETIRSCMRSYKTADDSEEEAAEGE